MTKTERKVIVVKVEEKKQIDLRGIVQAVAAQIRREGVQNDR